MKVNHFIVFQGCWSKVGIPPRRYRALLYYTEVLDSMVAELRELMHR